MNKEPEFIQTIRKIDNGRFNKLMDVIDWNESCMDCTYFNPKGTGAYRCCVDCIGCLLSDKHKKYILRQIKEANEK